MRILKWMHPWKVFVGVCVMLIIGGLLMQGPKRPSGRLPAQNVSNLDLAQIKDFKKEVIRSFLIREESGSESTIVFRLPVEICEQFKAFELVMEADGVSFNGDPVNLSIKKECFEISPETSEISWTIRAEDQPRVVTTPIPVWNVKSLNFLPKEGVQEIQISGYEFIFVLGKPASVVFH